MIYDRHPEMQSKWDKEFWARGYYVETIGNITDEAVQKYKRVGRRIKKRRLKRYRFITDQYHACGTALQASSKIALWRANIKPPVEQVVMT